MLQGANRAFYEEIALSLKQFIAFKLNLQASELSRQRITESLLANKVETALEMEVRQLIEKCDLALYAGYSDPSKIESTYQEAVQLITKLNEVL